MNLIQTLNQLRKDIQEWVTKNIRVVLRKLKDHNSDETAHSDIRDSLKAHYTDSSAHTDIRDTLISHNTDVTAHQDIREAIVTDYNELENAPSISDDEPGSVLYTDESGNIIARVDEHGLETTHVKAISVDLTTPVGVKLDGDISGEGHFTGTDFTITTEEKILNGLKGKFVNTPVGGISKGTTIDTDSIESLIATLLGVSSGVAPAQESFSFTISPNQIEPDLGTTSYTGITATWKIEDSATTYTGDYLPTIEGIGGMADALDPTTKKAGGIITGITIPVTDSMTSKVIGGSVTYSAGDGFEAGRLSHTQPIKINRKCYYGTEESKTTVSRDKRSSWTFTVTLTDEKAVFQYPKIWGKVTKITDANKFDVTEAFTRTEIAKNGGLYYQYALTSPNTGEFSYTIS